MRILRWNDVVIQLHPSFYNVRSLNQTPLRSFKSYFQHYGYFINALIYYIFTCDLYLINAIPDFGVSTAILNTIDIPHR